MMLDATAGGRMMWFDKNPDNVLFVDKRVVPPGSIVQQPLWSVEPDIQADFCALPFADNSFEMVVFDPPHATIAPESIIGTKFGTLTDLDEIAAGLSECWRVTNRWLIFKWADTAFTISEVLERIPFCPLFGHTTAKSGPTIWVTFCKGAGIGDDDA